MIGIFPELADVPFEFRWSGLVGMTLDSVPHVGRLDDRTLYSVGYNGAGVAMSSLMGRYLASLVRGETVDLGLLDARRRQDHSILSVARTGRPHGGRLVPVSGCDRALGVAAPDHNKRG